MAHMQLLMGCIKDVTIRAVGEVETGEDIFEDNQRPVRVVRTVTGRSTTTYATGLRRARQCCR